MNLLKFFSQLWSAWAHAQDTPFRWNYRHLKVPQMPRPDLNDSALMIMQFAQCLTHRQRPMNEYGSLKLYATVFLWQLCSGVLYPCPAPPGENGWYCDFDDMRDDSDWSESED